MTVTLSASNVQSLQRAGGARPASKAPPPSSPPSAPLVLEHQRIGTCEGYRQQSIADGIAPRPDGLFTDDDDLLLSLAADETLHSFEKHLPGEHSPYDRLPQGGWITGNEACLHRGIDLRLFYKFPEEDSDQYGKVLGAVRFGDPAAIGSGEGRFFLTAHGGAIETILDEATAELGKMVWQPFLSTVEANFKIRKPVPMNRTFFLRCEVTNQRGIRAYVHGEIIDKNGDNGEVVLATCDATLVDMVPFLK